MPQSEKGLLEADKDPHSSDNDGFSSLLSYASTASSIAGSMYDYQFENGRRYHAYRSGKYLLPNDEDEQERLDLVHEVWRLILGGRLHLAPLEKEKVKNILDLGTGTGIWANEIGEEYPGASVIGTDLSPIQPHWKASNVRFEVDDMEDEWTWGENTFDHIHIRNMMGAVKDWPKLIKNAYKHLKPGGFLEIHEMDTCDPASDDGTYDPETSKIGKYFTRIREGLVLTGTYIDLSSLDTLLLSAGFTSSNITSYRIKVPFSPWCKDPRKKAIGGIAQQVMEKGYASYGLALFTRVLGMSEEEAREIIDGARKETQSKKVHAYAKGYIWCGRKEESEPNPEGGSENEDAPEGKVKNECESS